MTALEKIGEHVFWLPPGPPDRPSLCAVVGESATVLLDGGASAEHARLILDSLAAEGVPPPTAVALTHSHWDHVFGAAEVAAPVIAHVLTAEALTLVAATDWSDAALDARVAAGEVTPEHAANVKEELPAPRDVQLASPEVVFDDGLDLELGGVRVRVRHVGGDHAPDSCVMFVEPDRVLFLGDCLYDAVGVSGRELTVEHAFPLQDAVLSFGAELYVDGHGEYVMPRFQAEALLSEIRFAGTLVQELAAQGGAPPDEADALAAAERRRGEPPSEDLAWAIGAFVAGLS
jgi:glyoxylase-like metal-dependent hydrolase (beta-lactamase superfamily II)